MQLCIFCPNPRTRKSGEHVWDDWLNREHGKDICKPSTVFVFGEDGAKIRECKATGLNETKPVVYDDCNNTWMSDITSFAKDEIEGLDSQGETHLYRCPTVGRLLLPPNGIMQVDDPADSSVRH